MDATVGDFLEAKADDPDIRIFALLRRGIPPLDGEKALLAIDRITSSGRTVIVYRAGRSEAGAAASAKPHRQHRGRLRRLQGAFPAARRERSWPTTSSASTTS
jgi:acyl-CoA synthetase (NDP forming)